MFVDVGSTKDFPEGVPQIVVARGREVGVIRWQGKFFALRNLCPHQYAPVCRGYVMPKIVGGKGGAMDIDADTPVLVCPWHGWEFDARTGRAAWGDTGHRLKAYPVKVEEDRVLLDVGRPTPAAVESATPEGAQSH